MTFLETQRAGLRAASANIERRFRDHTHKMGLRQALRVVGENRSIHSPAVQLSQASSGQLPDVVAPTYVVVRRNHR